MSGSGISIPSTPPGAVEIEIESMIKSGRFTLGEECAPYKFVKYVPVSGELTPQETVVMAWKYPWTPGRNPQKTSSKTTEVHETDSRF